MGGKVTEVWASLFTGGPDGLLEIPLPRSTTNFSLTEQRERYCHHTVIDCFSGFISFLPQRSLLLHKVQRNSSRPMGIFRLRDANLNSAIAAQYYDIALETILLRVLHKVMKAGSTSHTYIPASQVRRSTDCE